MKKGNVIFLTLALLLLSSLVFAQNEHMVLCARGKQTNLTGMYVLGSWAIVNMASGLYGWQNYENQSKYFHQMNFFWNTVNFSIAGFALYSNYQIDCAALNPAEILSKHQQTEKILLINSALDVGYIGTGFLLRHLSQNSTNRSDLLKGYGNSLALQGGFLLVFDLIMYGILNNQQIEFLRNIRLMGSTEMVGLQFLLNF